MNLILTSAAISAIFGVILEMATHDKPLRLLQYFTIQSNLIAGLAALLYLMAPSSFALQLIKASILWMLVTGIIFHSMISKFYKPSGLKWISNQLTHTLAPLLFFFALFFMESKGQSPMLWIAYPLVYSLFWLIYGHFFDYYPYWFLRPNLPYPDGMGSYVRVMGFIAAMTLGFLFLGFLLSLLN